MTLTAATIRKAVRLHEAGHVREVPATRVYQVTGDHDTYTVVIADELVTCTCPARRECAHIAAAGLTIREQAADTAN